MATHIKPDWIAGDLRQKQVLGRGNKQQLSRLLKTSVLASELNVQTLTLPIAQLINYSPLGSLSKTRVVHRAGVRFEEGS